MTSYFQKKKKMNRNSIGFEQIDQIIDYIELNAS